MTPLTTKLGRYETASLAISSRIPETEEVMARFEERLTEKIFERRLFQELYNESAAPETEVDLRVRCTLIKVASVSRGGRFLLGSWAGVTEFEVLVELTDGTSGESLGAFAAVGMSHGKSVLAAGSELDDAIDRAAEKIVEVLEKNR